MLHILLLILKIIGILLAALLGVLLLILACVLLVPVRYHIEAEGKPGREVPVCAKVKVSWLLHMVNVAFAYSGTAYVRIRIFCFPIFDSAKEKKQKKKKKVSKTGNEEKSREESFPDIQEDKKPPFPDTQEGKAEALPTAISEKDNGYEEALAEQDKSRIDIDASKEEPQAREKEGILEKIKAFFLYLKQILYRLTESLKNIEYTIKKICDKIKWILEIYESETFRKVWAVSKRQLFRVLKMLRPRICRLHLLAGTGDPAGAGQILAIYGILYPFIGSSVEVEADFENKVLEGDLLIKGRVRMVTFLLAAPRLFADRNIWRLFKMLKQRDNRT